MAYWHCALFRENPTTSTRCWSILPCFHYLLETRRQSRHNIDLKIIHSLMSSRLRPLRAQDNWGKKRECIIFHRVFHDPYWQETWIQAQSSNLGKYLISIKALGGKEDAIKEPSMKTDNARMYTWSSIFWYHGRKPSFRCSLPATIAYLMKTNVCELRNCRCGTTDNDFSRSEQSRL